MIPKGARNIRVEEVADAANFIVIQSVATEEYYLNGQWYELIYGPTRHAEGGAIIETRRSCQSGAWSGGQFYFLV